MPDGELDRLHDMAANGPPDLAATAISLLANGVQVEAQNVFYWKAWQELSTERAGGMGLTSIPLSAIWRFCDRYRMTSMESEVFEQVIRIIDSHFISLSNEKQQKATK